MPQERNNRSKPAAAALSLVLVSLALVACGGSSSASTQARASATSATSGARAPGGFATRFAAVRECLAKSGITLPKRTPGQPRPLGGIPGGDRQLPKGVTRIQYEAALRKCGLSRVGPAAGRERLASPAYKLALTNFAACMRQNGEQLPAPNTSGTGPIFNTSGLNASSPKFRAAETKCASILRSGFAPGGPGSGQG